MFETLACAFFTILPDYLIRRFTQGKRLGREITLFTVWYELRYGITACLMLAVMLFTVIFYYHPTATRVTSFFRTVAVLPEQAGRVTEVFAQSGEVVEAGAPIFALDASVQEAALAVAQRQVAGGAQAASHDIADPGKP
ncbi:MAG: biotin/lipoyl-binding protein, partial [Pseudomonadota bacterium]